MTFKEKFTNEGRWFQKVLIMDFYHLAQMYHSKKKNKVWTIKDTAKYFECSVGQVSENLQLARKLDDDLKLLSRNKALRFIRYGYITNDRNN